MNIGRQVPVRGGHRTGDGYGFDGRGEFMVRFRYYDIAPDSHSFAWNGATTGVRSGSSSTKRRHAVLRTDPAWLIHAESRSQQRVPHSGPRSLTISLDLS
jgi:hypothetical protein